MTPVLDTFRGLPVHVLVVHLTVVLLPLMSLVTVAVALRPRWRSSGALWVAVANGALVGLTWATVESGKLLQGRLSGLTGGPVAQEHGERGELMLWFAIGLFVVSLLVAVLGPRGGGAAATVAVAAVVVGVAVIGWAIAVGESGAQAVWEQTIANTDPAGG